MGTIITFVVIGLVLNLLRSKWVWVEYLMYIFMVGGAIVAWIADGFIAAIVVLFIMGILAWIAFGRTTKVNLKGKEYDIECKNCGYNHTDIISKKTLDNGDVEILYHCPRCDTMRVWVFGRRK